MLRIRLHRLSDERHRLELVRADGRREAVTLETRSTLLHDLLHLAVEAEAGLEGGFWGNLARGKTLDDLDDRSGARLEDAGPELMAIERLVGALHRVTRETPAAALVAGVTAYLEGAGAAVPPWLTVSFVESVRERMRRLRGRWRATPFGGTMELTWPAPAGR